MLAALFRAAIDPDTGRPVLTIGYLLGLTAGLSILLTCGNSTTGVLLGAPLAVTSVVRLSQISANIIKAARLH